MEKRAVNKYSDMITVQIASIPDREESLRLTVNSLRSQVNNILVGLNGYDHIPDFLNNGEYVCLDNSRGDAAKFYDVEYLNGYVFTCDDDLVYPAGYVNYMKRKVDEYKCIVTLHGKHFLPNFSEFWHCAVYPCLKELVTDVQVHVGGTGVMAFHTDYVKVKYSDFELPNMADIWMAKVAHEQGVRIMCIAHPEHYLKYIKPKTTLWRTEADKLFAKQVEILKTFL
jgi:hypothetical protein